MICAAQYSIIHMVAEPNRGPISPINSESSSERNVSPFPVQMQALVVGKVMASCHGMIRTRGEKSKQDAAKNSIDDGTQVILKTSSSTTHSVQAYKRQCNPSDNYDDATDG